MSSSFRFSSAPLFFTFLLIAGIFAGAFTVPAAAQLTVRHEWSDPLSNGPGFLRVADLDGQGPPEILTTSWDDLFYVLAFDGSGYSVRRASLSLYIDQIAVGQADADPQLEIVVLTDDELHVYDGADFSLEQVFPASGQHIAGAAVGDVDGDGEPEAVYLDHQYLFIQNLLTGTVERTEDGFGGSAVALGQTDDDAALEIAVAKGDSTGYILDGASAAVEHEIAGGLGVRVVFADFDADPYDELVALLFYDELQVHDLQTETLLWHVPVSAVDSLAVADLTGDGIPEVLYGTGQWGKIRVRDGVDGEQLFTVLNPGNGFAGIGVADFDGDSELEITFGVASSSLGAEEYLVLDAATRTVEWTRYTAHGPTYGVDHGDVDGDGRPEIVTTATRGDWWDRDGFYRVYDADTLVREQERPGSADTGGYDVWRARTANLDADAQGEVCMNSSIFDAGKLYCFDGSTGAREWEATLADGLNFHSLEIADVDGDGDLDVVGGTGDEHTGAPGAYVFAYTADGQLLWQSPDLTGSFYRDLDFLRVAEVDGDPDPEVVVALYEGELYILDGTDGSVELATGDLDVSALAVSDPDGDGTAEILIGTAGDALNHEGSIRRIDPVTGTVDATLTTYPDTIRGLVVRDLNGDGVPDYLFGNAGALVIHDGAIGAEIWRSPHLGSWAGGPDALLAADVDSDREIEILVGTPHGPVLFEIAHPGELFQNGFESGDISAWEGSAP